MMNGKELFYRRLKEYFLFFNRLRQLSIDWAVWTYILIPLILVSIGQYVYLWNSDTPWAVYINEPILGFILTLIAMGGYCYSFLHQADLLFLWQYQDLLRGLKWYRFVYYLFTTFFRVFLSSTVLAPILFVYLNWNTYEFLLLIMFLFFISVLNGLTKRFLKIRFSPWKYRVLMVVILCVNYLLFTSFKEYSLIFVVGIIPLVMVYSRLWINQKFNLYREINLDQLHKTKYTQLILMQSSLIGAPEFITERISNSRKNPRLFRKSNRIFKRFTAEMAYQEIYLKSLIRGKWFKLYVQFIAFGLFGILIFPFWLKWLIWFGVIILIGNMLKIYWIKMMGNRFLELVQWRELNYKTISRQTFEKALIPAAIILSATLGFVVYSFLGLLLVSCIGIFISLKVSKFFANKVI